MAASSAFDYGRFQLDAFQIDPVTLLAVEQDYVASGYLVDGYVFGELVRRGGDDAHFGWDKKAWQKKQKREAAVEATIRETYNRIMGIEPEPEVVEEVRKEALQESPKPATTDYSGVTEWLQAQQAIVAQILAKRAEEDDEETLLMLL